MPTKTDSILGNLPLSFRVATRGSALRAVSGAIGGELQGGEVALARILRSHWLDSADQGASEIDDLARLGSLWGLAPLCDSEGGVLESVEEFREHLRRYVRTLLEGTVTVKGILRLASDILGVRVAIDGQGFDPWWARSAPVSVSVIPRGNDATARLFGVPRLEASGVDAQPARIVGPDLGAGVALGERRKLTLQIDGYGPRDIALPATIGPAELDAVVAAINEPFPGPVARHDGRRLIIESLVVGADGVIEVEEDDDDAAPIVLGLPARVHTGERETGASLRSRVDLSGGLDLRARRFLRVVIDGVEVREIDCAGPAPELTLLDHLCDRINAEFAQEIASHDGRFLTLASQTAGNASSIMLQAPAAGDCRGLLFGESLSFFLGSDARPARAKGAVDLRDGVDLSDRAMVRVRIDGGPVVSVNCAGLDPARTAPNEVVTLLDAALGQGTATTNGERLELVSRIAGHEGQIVFESAGDEDALLSLFGIGPREFHGHAALPAAVRSEVNVSNGVKAMATNRIGLSLDGRPPVEIDVRSHAIEPTSVQPAELVDAINAKFPGVAFTDGEHLLLTSPTVGAASRISLSPLTIERRRRFTTRAMVLEEAAEKVLGFTARRATGEAATKARIVGTPDLSAGVDLRSERWLTLSIDGAPPVTVDCAGARPRATVPSEISARLRGALQPDQAADDGKHLLLISPSVGSGSAIEFHPVTVQDAAAALLGPGAHGERRGSEPSRVVFVSTVDLSQGIELEADARIAIGLDGGEVVTVPLNPSPNRSRVSLGALAGAINRAFAAGVASQDGRRLTVSSLGRGKASQLRFERASGTDATRRVLGIDAPRSYQGEDGTRAEIAGTILPGSVVSDSVVSGSAVPGTVDLSLARFLRVALDGRAPITIDCAATASNPSQAKLEEVVTAINTANDGAANGVALSRDGRLVLRSPTLGSASRLALHPYVAGDARAKLFGAAPERVRGVDPQPARLLGDVSLLETADLAVHRVLRVAVDGAPPLEIDLAGVTPEKTSELEIMSAIERAAPGVASLTPEGRLVLTSRAVGEAASVEVLGRRFLELIEYPPEPRARDVGPLHHAQSFELRNPGAAASTLALRLFAERGVVDPTFINHSLGLSIGVQTVVRPGDTLVLEPAGDASVIGRIESPLAPPRTLDAHELLLSALSAGGVPHPPLELSRGTSHWTYLECTGSRFGEASFDAEHFAGVPCSHLGVFDVSRLNLATADGVSRFWPSPPAPEPSARLSVSWEEFRSGAFELNLPAELPPVFGGRFDEARFGLGRRSELFERVVFEPKEDPDYIEKVINTRSSLVEASDVLARPPIGFTAQAVPFRKPRALSLGGADEPARVYLSEPGGRDGVIELKARDKGTWGNQITVSLRPDGPARYQLEIFYAGERFEGARDLVLGGVDPMAPPLDGTAAVDATATGSAGARPPHEDIPPPGVLQAKAAGVRARVTRDGAGQ